MIRRYAFPVALAVLITLSAATPATSPHPPLNTSSDGRWHTCGLITQDGVTEHLDAYRERCEP